MVLIFTPGPGVKVISHSDGVPIDETADSSAIEAKASSLSVPLTLPPDLAFLTFIVLINKHPHVLWIQLAPTPLLYIAYFYKLFFNKTVVIIADCHNSMFCHPWIILPKAVYLLNRCEIVLVHNRSVREEAISLGIEPNHLYILDCYPSHTKVVFTQAMKARYNFPRPWILFPYK